MAFYFYFRYRLNFKILKAPMKHFKLYILWIFLIAAATSAFTANNQENLIRSEILQRLYRWPYDFNNKNLSGVCSLFASDVIATYPDVKDRNYIEMCNHFAKIFSDASKEFHYEQPQIEQVLISQDLVVVRLTWTLSILDKNTANVTHIQERGLDVFKKQSDGTWKIAISYAYPLEN